MVGTIERDGNNKITTQPSAYSSSTEVTNLTKKIKQDYELGVRIQNTPYRQFGGEGISFLQERENNQKFFTNYEEPRSQDPAKKWRDKGIRPVTRNKILPIRYRIYQT